MNYQNRSKKELIREINKLKNKSGHLQQEYSFYKNILKNMKEGVNLVNPKNGLIIYTNSRFEQKLG